MITYKVEKEAVDKGDIVISKTGHSHEFTVAEVLQHELQLEKEIKQIEAQKELEDAKMENISRNNPKLMKLTKEEMHAVHMYWESKVMSDQCVTAKMQREEALREYAGVKKDVKEQTGVEIV
jgi:hypothetical protein